MKIRIVNSRATRLDVHTIETEETKREPFEFSFSPKIDATEEKTYFIVFNLSIVHRDQFRFSVTYESKFSTDDEITEDFTKSKFISINSPAIAYPFLRAYVANIMLISGFDPMMLPTINFTDEKFYKPEASV